MKIKSADQIRLEEAYTRILLKENASVDAPGMEKQPDLTKVEGSVQIKKDPAVKYKWRVSTGGQNGQGEEIASLEPDKSGQYKQLAPKGNIIITGLIKTPHTPEGEEWSQKPEKFDKDYTKAGDGICTAKGTSPVQAFKMDKPFKVQTSWGSVLQGKVGDYLTQYAVGDYGVLDQQAAKAYYGV